MAIYRGAGGSGNSNQDSYLNAVTVQAVIATDAASAASLDATATAADVILTHADVVTTAAQTNADAVSTGQDATATAADVVATATSETNAATSASTASTQASTATTQAGVSTTKAGEASTSASNASTSASAAAAALVLTNADVVLTHADVVLAEADKVQTALDRVATNADVVLTHADVVLAEADKVQTGLDRAAVAADLVLTNQDTLDTAADVVLTNADVVSAEAAKVAAELAYDSFDDRYLGAKSSAPTTDNDNQALITGALYFNSTSGDMKVYNGSAWLDVYTLPSGLATETYVGTQISNLVDSSPAALNTLNELAAALGDDANFSTTVTNSIATKLPLAGGTLTGDVSHGDNVKAKFGAGDDLTIYHNGSDSIIEDQGVGNLVIKGTDLYLRNASNSNRLYAGTDVRLYHDGSQKLATTSTGVDVTGTVNSDHTTLNPIATTITDTAVDVFVYDTSKDSDGGQWRKRTQATSWYNEALNTATRGSRKEFPAVAVIVAESNKITIYDGDDPAMPMWMVFNDTGATGVIAWNSGGIKNQYSVSMLNSTLVTGADGGSTLQNFISDDIRLIQTGDWHLTSGRTVADRNNTTSIATGEGEGYVVINSNVNDIAMTVLPNAPIDSATGLPIPTIAVATDGGVSVIKDDGSVVDLTLNSASWAKTAFVTIDNDYVTFGTNSGSADSAVVWRVAMPSADQSWSEWEHDGGAYLRPLITKSSMPNVVVPRFLESGSVSSVAKETFGSGAGLTAMVVDNADHRNSLHSYITSDYNTGYMVGDIKLAALSDTDATNVVGSGTNIISGWTNHPTYPFETYTGSGLDITSAINTTSYGTLNTTYTPVIGRTYTVKFNLTLNSGTAPTFFGQSTSSVGAGAITFVPVAGANSYTWTGTTAVSSYINLMVSNGVASDFSISGFTMYVGSEEDRSVNANGLQVFGTVTKSAVAVGADTVAYSGFGTSNYLEQPYNSDLDFGTGDFSVMGWMKHNAVTQYMITRSTVVGGFNIRPISNGFVYFQVGGTTLTTGTFTIGQWGFFVASRVNGVASWSFNAGTPVSTAATDNVDSASSPLSIGVNNSDYASAYAGSLALLRISATAPSASQIKTIYEAEKVLFQENAQATLYGTSDAVTALAHDDSTGILSVGTSSGRSDFQGLRRVNNTTTAVGTAISASNGLVVED